MKPHPQIKTYGNLDFRGYCPTEQVEQVTFFNRLRAQHPKSYGLIAIHPRNEGKRTHGQVRWQKAEGMVKGASDVIIPGNPAFVCELKRKDRTKSTWQKGQLEYLLAAQEAGAFACLAFGANAALEAFEAWLNLPK